MHALLRLQAELHGSVSSDLVDVHVVVTIQVREHFIDDLLVFARHFERLWFRAERWLVWIDERGED